MGRIRGRRLYRERRRCPRACVQGSYQQKAGLSLVGMGAEMYSDLIQDGRERERKREGSKGEMLEDDDDERDFFVLSRRTDSQAKQRQRSQC